MPTMSPVNTVTSGRRRTRRQHVGVSCRRRADAASETEARIFNISISELYMWETMHRHSTNAVIQFIQIENMS